MMIVDEEKCKGCGQCLKDCCRKDIELVEGKAKINNINCCNCGHCIAICPTEAVSTDEYSMADVKSYKKDEFLIEADNLLNFIKFRRSIRQFLHMEVEEYKIRKIIEAGRFTQTGANMQDVSYIVVREGLKELKSLTIETLNEMGKHILSNLTPETMPFKVYAEMWVKGYESYKFNPEDNDYLFFNAPAVIIVTSNLEINGALASSNMELMTNALGLGTFFSGFFVKAAENNKKIRDFIEVKEGKKVVSCMAIGYPMIKYYRTVPRKEADISWK